jgi:hypothetical protein
MTRRYGRRVGGTLLEEYLVVQSGPGIGPRRLDGIIILGGDHRIAPPREHVSLNGRDLIVVQTKASRLSMYLLGAGPFLARADQGSLLATVGAHSRAMWR